MRNGTSLESQEPARPLVAPKRGIPIAWLQLTIVFVILAAAAALKIADPDFWWHLRTGKLIFDSGIPMQDPFSWTAAGKDWVAHEWLSEALIYGVEAVAGYAGNFVLFSAVLAASLAVMYALGRRLGAGTKVLVILTMLAAVVFFRFAAVRPQVFTWLLFAVFVYALQREEDGHPLPVWVLPSLMLLWVNLHLGFTFGILAVAVWVLSRLYRRVRRESVDLRRPALLLAACLFAACVNPRGPLILWYPLEHYLAGDAYPSFIVEWNRPDFTSPAMIPNLLAVVFLAASCLLRPRPFLTGLSLVAIALAMLAVRNLPFVALLMVPVAGSALAARWHLASAAGDSDTRVRLIPSAAGVSVLGVLLIVAAQGRGLLVGWDPPDRNYPAAAVAYLEENAFRGRLFNDYNWGGYLINELYPDVLVFVDGRSDFYEADFLEEYLSIAWMQSGWRERLAEYDIDAVLIRSDSDMAREFRKDPSWREVVREPLESLFILSPAPPAKG